MKENKKKNFFSRTVDFFSSGLSSQEFERVFMHETPARYRYIVRSMEKSNDKGRPMGFLRFSKNFLAAFLRKLSPVVRIIYAATLLYFFIAVVNGNWEMGILAFTVVNLIFMFEVADKFTARDELEVARDVQSNLIPGKLPKTAFFDTAFYYETANEVGGDFLDHMEKNGKDLFLIGDISGKGMAAALYMVQVRLLLRYMFDNNDNCREVLIALNRALLSHLKKGLFFTAILALADQRRLTIFRAGHNPALYYSSLKRECAEVRQNGMGVGLTNGKMFDSSIEEAIVETVPGDIVLFYSDGLTETMNRAGEEFGMNRLKAAILKYSHDSADSIKDSVVKEVTEFRGYAEIHDDITLIVMKAV